MKKNIILIIAIAISTAMLGLISPGSASALRPTVPCGLNNPFSQPCSNTTTTTTVRQAQTFYLPNYFPQLEIGLDGWMILNNVHLGDTVIYLGTSYVVTDLGGDFIPSLQPGTVTGDGICSVNEYVRPTVQVTGIAPFRTYEQKLKFKLKPVDSGSEGTAVRIRYVIYDTSGNVKGDVVKKQTRKVGKKLVVKGLPAGHYYIELFVRYVHNNTDCGRNGWHVLRGFAFDLL